MRRSSRVWMNNLLRPCERDPNILSSHPDLEAVALSEEEDLRSDHMVGDLKETQSLHATGKKDGKVKGPKSNGESNGLEEALLFSDVYRYLHPDDTTGYTNWDTSTDARKSNYGRRLDYILVDTGLADHVTDCRIMTEVEGSDHCPVVVTLDCQPLSCPNASPPSLCSKLMPEFRGQQQKLSSFFTKKVVSKKANTDSSSSQNSSSSRQEDKEATTIANEPAQLKKATSVPISSSSSPKKSNLKRGKSVAGIGGSNLGAPLLKKNKQTGTKQASLTSFFGLKANSSINLNSDPLASSNSFVKCAPNRVPSQGGDVICVQVQDPVTSNNFDELPSNYDKVQSVSLSKNNEQKDGHVKTTLPSVSPLENKKTSNSSQSWKSLLCGPAPPPLCPGHNEPCVLKTVRKNGPNKNKQFYSCPRPDGPPGNSQFRCNFFQWLHDRQKKKT